jgi:sensor histidine kinase regulating citrate/malate metabolism
VLKRLGKIVVVVVGVAGAAGVLSHHGGESPRVRHEWVVRPGSTETQGRRGSGVGLALVRHVAEAHGGRVTVESSPGEGSRFTLRLPLAGGRGGTGA